MPNEANVCTYVFFLMYTPLCRCVLDVFHCTRYAGVDGTLDNLVLVGDTSVACYGKEHGVLMVLGCIFLMLYCVGIPLLSCVFVTMLNRRRMLDDARVRDVLGFVYDGYEMDGWKVAWESVVMLRKFLLSCVIAFFSRDDAYLQALFGCGVGGLLLLVVVCVCARVRVGV